MKALIAEYTRFHDSVLAPEGEAMFQVIRESFTRCGYEVLSPGGEAADGSGDFLSQLRSLAPLCDYGLVIAPDELLPKFTMVIEQFTHNIGCGSMNAAVCANKQRSGQILAAHGVPVPAPKAGGLRVVKPARGCGSAGIRLTDGPAGPGEFGQEYIDGEALSVSLVGGRVTGDVCEFYSGLPSLLLAVNRQDIGRDAAGNFRYCGGETPVLHERHEEIVGTARKALDILGCQGYTGVDVVVADRVFVVDVNPRPTTSITGICACMDEEIADILVNASKGALPASVHLSGTARFDSSGMVTLR